MNRSLRLYLPLLPILPLSPSLLQKDFLRVVREDLSGKAQALGVSGLGWAYESPYLDLELSEGQALKFPMWAQPDPLLNFKIYLSGLGFSVLFPAFLGFKQKGYTVPKGSGRGAWLLDREYNFSPCTVPFSIWDWFAVKAREESLPFFLSAPKSRICEA